MEINILKEQEAATLREMIAASHRIVYVVISHLMVMR